MSQIEFLNDEYTHVKYVFKKDSQHEFSFSKMYLDFLKKETTENYKLIEPQIRLKV